MFKPLGLTTLLPENDSMMSTFKIISIATAFLVTSVTLGSALPPCPSNSNATWSNCSGSYTFKSGDTYSGEWLNDELHGTGIYNFKNGQKYVGKFLNGERNGKGTYTWPNGQKYVGEYLNDEKHGKGTYTWPDGQKYVGEFLNDERHGKGLHLA